MGLELLTTRLPFEAPTSAAMLGGPKKAMDLLLASLELTGVRLSVM